MPRASSTARGYGSDWQKLRRQFLAANPACCVCGEAATHVHHRVGLAEGGEPLAWENLRPYCKLHHVAEEAAKRRKPKLSDSPLLSGVMPPKGKWHRE